MRSLTFFKFFPHGRHIAEILNHFGNGFQNSVDILFRVVFAKAYAQRAVRDFVRKTSREQNVRRV